MKTGGKSEGENRGMDGERQKRTKHLFNRGVSGVFVHAEACCVFDGLRKKGPVLFTHLNHHTTELSG